MRVDRILSAVLLPWAAAFLLDAVAQPAEPGPQPLDATGLPAATLEGAVAARIQGCGSNPPPIPVANVPVELLVDGRPVAAARTDGAGAFEVPVPARVPARLRVLLPFDFPIVYEGVVVPERTRLDLGPLIGTVRFEPGLVAARFAPETSEERRQTILERCRLDPEGRNADRQLARTRDGAHVVRAIACLLRFVPDVLRAEPGRYLGSCGPGESALF